MAEREGSACRTVGARHVECVAGSGTEPQVTHGRPCGPIMLSTDTQSVARDRGKQWRGDRPPGKARLAVLRRQAFSGGDGTVGMATRAWELSPCPCDTGPGVPTWLHVGVTWGAVKWTGVQAPSGSAPPASLGMEPGARNGPRPRGVLACTPDWGTLLGGRSLPSCPRSPGWSTGCSRKCHHWALLHQQLRAWEARAWTEGRGLSLGSHGRWL